MTNPYIPMAVYGTTLRLARGERREPLDDTSSLFWQHFGASDREEWWITAESLTTRSLILAATYQVIRECTP